MKVLKDKLNKLNVFKKNEKIESFEDFVKDSKDTKIKWYNKEEEIIKKFGEYEEPYWIGEPTPSLIEFIMEHTQYLSDIDKEENQNYSPMVFLKIFDVVVNNEILKSDFNKLLIDLQLQQMNFEPLGDLLEILKNSTSEDEREKLLRQICLALAKEFMHFNLFVLGEKGVLPKLYNPEHLTDKVKYNKNKKTHWFNQDEEIKNKINEAKAKVPREKYDFNDFIMGLYSNPQMRNVNFKPYSQFYFIDYIARYYFEDDTVNYDYFKKLEFMFKDDFYETYYMPYMLAETIEGKEKILKSFTMRIIKSLESLHKIAIEKMNKIEKWYKDPKHNIDLSKQKDFEDGNIPDALLFLTKTKEEIFNNPNSIDPNTLYLKIDKIFRKAFEKTLDEDYVKEIKNIMNRTIFFHNHSISQNRGDKPLLERTLEDICTQFVLRFNQMKNTALKKIK